MLSSGTNNIFQSPWLLLTISVIALGVTAIIRQTWPQKRRWWQIPVFVMLAAASFGIDYFVKTDYEKIPQDTGKSQQKAGQNPGAGIFS